VDETLGKVGLYTDQDRLRAKDPDGNDELDELAHDLRVHVRQPR